MLNMKRLKDQPKSPAELTIEENQIVDDYKETLTNSAVLVLSWAAGHYFLDSDDCNIQDECVLLQQQLDGLDRTVIYFFMNSHPQW